MKENTWNDHGNPLRGPTWAYKWDVVSEFTSDPQRMYEQYVNEFDTLTPDQVTIAKFEIAYSLFYLNYPN
jgi:hypothetical protein